MRKRVFWIATLFVFVALNGMIAQKQRLLASGQVMYLKLAPVDPRSLIQGDYMALRYEVLRNLTSTGQAPEAADGAIVVRLDANSVATFARFHHGQPLAPDERLLRYRCRDGQFRIGAESYFFQEGQAGQYRDAKFGELRVTASGDCVLVGLRDEKLQRLGGR